jgi:hypothetical protein
MDCGGAFFNFSPRYLYPFVALALARGNGLFIGKMTTSSPLRFANQSPQIAI